MTGKNTSLIFLIFLLTSLFIFVIHSSFTGTSVFADAKFYYSYTRSIVFDRNLLLGNEYFNLRLLNEMPSDQFTPSFYPPGVSIFWLPLFSVTFGFMNLIKIFFPLLKATGYEPVFEYSCGLTNIFLGIFGLYLVYRTLTKYFSEKISILTTTTLFLTTNLFFYIAVEPINSHAASFFISALFIYYLLNHPKDKYYYPALGIIGGVAGLIRTQDLLILILPMIQILWLNRYTIKELLKLLLKRSLKLKLLRTLIIHPVLLLTGFLIGFSPQLLLWKYFYNTFWYSPYFEVGFNFLKPQILHVLFNSQNGLFTTTPMIAIAFLGLFYKIIKLLNGTLNGKWKIVNGKYLYSAFYFLLQIYIISSWNVYTQGGSYSIRMMVTTYPLLSFGLAYIIERAINKIEENKTIYMIGGFTILNILSILNYLLKY